MISKRFLLFALLSWIGRGGVRAQSLSVTPSTLPLDGSFTLHFSGATPGSVVSLGWDQAQPGILSNVLISTIPTTDSNGNLEYTLDLLPFRVYPATTGDHTLTVSFFPPFNSGIPVDPSTGAATVAAQVTLLPRTGWSASVSLPTQASPKISGGLLAFLHSSPDYLTTSIGLSDGAASKIWATLPQPNSVVGQPEWSPDGTKLAFSADVDTGPDSNLYVIDSQGHETQATNQGGTFPVFTGEGPGSVMGAALPYLGQNNYHTADQGQENCGESLNTNTNPPTPVPSFPLTVHVNLVGTSFSTNVALPSGSVNGDPYPFRFDNVPEGKYWVNMSYTTSTCREYTKINPQAGPNNPNQPATLIVHDKAVVVVSTETPALINAGQTTQLEPERLSDFVLSAQPPTWLDGQSLLYGLTSSFSTDLFAPTFNLWSVPLEGTPVQLTDEAQPNQSAADSPDVSTTTKRVIGVATSRNGLFFADSANLATSRAAVTSPQAILASTNVSVIDIHPTWSPDGNYIAYVRTQSIERPPLASDPGSLSNAYIGGILGDLWVQDVSTGREGYLTQLDNIHGEGVFGRPAWSPDRSQIAVSYTPDNFKTVNVRIVNIADASKFDLTTDGHSAFPAWTGQATLDQFPTGVTIAPPGAPVVPAQALGDVNGDTHVDVSDAVVALQAAVQQIQLSPAQVQAADVNKDTLVDVRDVVKILRVAVKLDPGF